MIDDNNVNRDVSVSDMIFFDRRLNEIIYHKRRKAIQWRAILLVTILVTIYGGYFWVIDLKIRDTPLLDSLSNHALFTISSAFLIILFFPLQIQKRVISSSIISSRCRRVLAQYYLHCDDDGKLIIQRTA